MTPVMPFRLTRVVPDVLAVLDVAEPLAALGAAAWSMTCGPLSET